MNHTQSDKIRKKRMLWVIACVIALTVTAGCGGNNGNKQDGGNGAATDNGSGTNDQSGNGGVTDPGTAEPDPATPDPAQPDNNGGDAGSTPDPADNGVKKAEGMYVGQVDTHSVEIKMNDTATVFQIDDKIADQLAKIKDNSTVAYEYIEKDTDVDGEKIKQLWLTKIEQL